MAEKMPKYLYLTHDEADRVDGAVEAIEDAIRELESVIDSSEDTYTYQTLYGYRDRLDALLGALSKARDEADEFEPVEDDPSRWDPVAWDLEALARSAWR